MKIRTGDNVVVISGKDKGKTGSVLRVLPSVGRVVVAGINMRTKHVKATAQQAGQRLQYEASIDVSNVMAVDPKTKKRTRLGYTVTEKGRKERLAKKSGEILSRAVVAKAASTTEGKAAAPAKKKTGKKAVEATKVDKPEKQAFWKKVGFGAGELEEAGVEAAVKENRDHSVPDQGKTPDSFNHQRGK
ncbi:50S ribosomal protein L24 [Candidatus Peregrinibacteria bacterium CG11_big_fil_rev_8_21_14_0_20_49_14]|nr:MAG: 50S ribosomal protein L24 [Candidatus Peregrinibacteria bacterium CG11_big_fil_rev_8_21_14_0_20_49_14]